MMRVVKIEIFHGDEMKSKSKVLNDEGKTVREEFLGWVIAAIILLFILSFCGCSTKTPTEFAKETQPISSVGNEQAMVNACLEWMAKEEREERARYDSLPADEKAFALMHRETMSMVKNVWGKESNVCKPGTNQWDAYQTYVKETEATKRQYASDAKSVATFGIVTTGAVKLADAVMGRVGDRISTTGDNSGVNKTTTTTNTTTVAAATGQGQATANGGGTSGEKGKEETASTTVNPLHWQDCTTSPKGTPTIDEVNKCMQDYGYKTEVKDGQLYLDGKPYNG